jgi:hypothetical protein
MKGVAITALVVGTCASGLAIAQSQPEVLIMGGRSHDEFLGCLTCGEMSRDSVWNDMSRYGWGNSFGVWNGFGQHKSRFSTTSACNEFASNPPILVDRRGNTYGALTLNEFRQGSVCGAGGVERLCNALRVMCATD